MAENTTKTEKSLGAVLRAKIIHFFKETFRYHSKAEYKEIFSRGLNDVGGGITGGIPWLHVRAFFALLCLFTVNVLVLRLTGNVLYVPSVIFLGGITFIIPFFILLYELYPKRDVNLFLLLTVLVGGGTVAGVLTQVGYLLTDIRNVWLGAVFTGVLEEFSKIIPSIIVILFFKQKDGYACFLFAAAVGAGFSVIEDMGYIFYYSDVLSPNYYGDIHSMLVIFTDRGLSSFCTHILWTGAVGWAYGVSQKPFKSFWFIVLLSSVALHIFWDLPLDGIWHTLVIFICVICAVAINVAIIHKSRLKILSSAIDLERFNEQLILEAKTLGERLRFKNAANLTFSLTVTLLSVIILALCALPIGMEYSSIEFEDAQSFINYVQNDLNLSVNWNRLYDETSENAEEWYRNGELSYVLQSEDIDGVDGEYLYGYGCYSSGYELEGIFVNIDVDDVFSRIECQKFEFGSESIWAFNLKFDDVIEYTYNSDGTVVAVISAEEFEGYDLLIALTSTACTIAFGCTVILIAFTLKLRRVKEDER